MIRYFAAHPTAANILMLAIIAIGLVAPPNLNKETFPKIDLNQVQVSVAYPGASPSDVEEGICNSLEDATDGISFTKEQRCEARDNIGMLTMEMQESGEIRQFIDDIKSAVDGITDFPENTEDPVITEALDLYRGKINGQISLKEYVKAEEMSWAHFVCYSVGNVERYEDSWQVNDLKQ